jgi:hypothetical protein
MPECIQCQCDSAPLCECGSGECIDCCECVHNELTYDEWCYEEDRRDDEERQTTVGTDNTERSLHI